jgi:hypothetical protein
VHDLKCDTQTLFVITNPDVYKNPSSDTYIIFGQAVVENTADAAMQQTGNKAFENMGMAGMGAMVRATSIELRLNASMRRMLAAPA